jgi:hypothetical protein
MARLVGFILLVVGVWLGASIYSEGSESVLGGRLGWKSETPSSEETASDSALTEREMPRAPGQAAPTAVTSRVRERVTAAVAEGTSRHGGE